jgi:hypothetical protein
MGYLWSWEIWWVSCDIEIQRYEVEKRMRGLITIANNTKQIMCHASHVLLSYFNISIKLYVYRFAHVLDERIHSQVTADAAAAAAGKVR